MNTRRHKLRLGLATALLTGAVGSSVLADTSHAIVGGVAVAPSIYPEYVRVRTSENKVCGGTVIAADIVLTAAHCVDGGVTTTGSSVLVSDAISRPVTGILIHPLWNPDDFSDGHDLAMLDLAPGSTNGVAPIQVGSPWNASYYEPGTPAAIVGHGWTSGASGHVTAELRAVDTVLRSDDDMDDIYNPWYWFDGWNESLMIGAGRHDQTACEGDSGGPVVVDKDGTWNWIQVGVASFVDTWPTHCREPAGFSELRNAQLAWIAYNVPAVMNEWGSCYAPSGRVGRSFAQYVGWYVNGAQRDGRFYWEIVCREIPNPPPPPPPPGPNDPPPSTTEPPPTTEPPDPPVCHLPPWKCPD
jgi:trypsin